MAIFDELRKMTFANEAEEAAWWESHEDALFDEFEKATDEGRIGTGTAAKRAASSSPAVKPAAEESAL
jgi:hypothetical protein